MKRSSLDSPLCHNAPQYIEPRDFNPPGRCLPKDDEYKILTKTKCEGQCRGIITTTTTTTSPELEKLLIKRTFHGGINFVTNFCIMPICVVIARFYKETFNMKTVKGAKPWYWVSI